MPESHYPECTLDTRVNDWCICDRLRACEKRILLSKPNIELSALYGYEAGRVDGINAAREAVAALPWWSLDPMTLKRADALAAIDALTAHDSSDTGTKVPGGAS